MFKYSFQTWFIANLIHPMLMIAGWLLLNGIDEFQYWDYSITIFITFSIFSFICSFPILFFAWIILKLIAKTDFTPTACLVMWVLTTPVLLFLIVLAFQLLSSNPNVKDYFPFIPSMLSSCVAILIRPAKFYQLLIDQSDNNYFEFENPLIN